MTARVRRLAATLAAASLAAALIAGCGSSVGLTSASTHDSHARGDAGRGDVGRGAAMAGMNMAGGTASETPAVNGIKPLPSQSLATAYWQGMKIQARTMTPTTFVVFTSTGHEQTFKANPRTSFHLMIMLSDRHTGVPIPYASVWATILSSSGRVVFDQRQWPMISAYMGPHYGNNVTLPGPGRYTLKLLISPPVAARHMEYARVWQRPHQVVAHFTWKPAS